MASSPSRVVAVLELVGGAGGVDGISESEDGHRYSGARNDALNHIRRVIVAVVVARGYVSCPDQGCLQGSSSLRSCRFCPRSSYHKQAYGQGYRCCCACEHNAHRVLECLATHKHTLEYVSFLRATWGRLLPRRG